MLTLQRAPVNQVTRNQANEFPQRETSKSTPEMHHNLCSVSTLDMLGISTDRPKYPAYAIPRTRKLSFQNVWKKRQTPDDLSQAGFFYGGHGDRVRCFFCGGGLENWNDQDDPWVEHAQWFPRCVFLTQNKGKEFVEKVQRMVILQQMSQMHLQNDSVKDISADKPSIQIAEPASTFLESIPAQSVIQMGYSTTMVKQALSIWSRDRKEEELKAEYLLDIIFKLEDEQKDSSVSENLTVVSDRDTTPSRDINISSDGMTIADDRIHGNESSNGNHTHHMHSNESLEKDSCHGDRIFSVGQSNNLNGDTVEDGAVDEAQNGCSREKACDVESLQDENRQLKDLTMCKICMNNTVNVVFLPCGHLATCNECAPALRKCPICRVMIRGTIKTFMS